MFSFLGAMPSTVGSWFSGLMGSGAAAPAAAEAGGLLAGGNASPLPPMNEVTVASPPPMIQSVPLAANAGQPGTGSALAGEMPGFWSRFTTAASNPSLAQTLMGASSAIRGMQPQEQRQMAPAPAPMSFQPRGFTPLQAQQVQQVMYRPRTTISGLLGGGA